MTLGDTLFTLVTFLVLMLAVGKVAWKPVSKMMAIVSRKFPEIWIMLKSHAKTQML